MDGIWYFNCELGYGVFIRPSQIWSIHSSELDAGPSFQKPAPSTGRSSGIGHQRSPSTGGLLCTSSVKPPTAQSPSPKATSTRPPSTSIQLPHLVRNYFISSILDGVRLLNSQPARDNDARLMRELKERHTESHSFLPKLQDKLRKF